MDELETLGARVLAICFAPMDALDRFQARLELPFPVATDPSKRVYRAYGMTRGSRWDVWHPRVLWKYVRLVMKGMELESSKEDEDLSQMGGDFVIDGQGALRFAHQSRRSDDRPSATTLIARLREAAAVPGSDRV